jgi:hypothetical protein
MASMPFSKFTADPHDDSLLVKDVRVIVTSAEFELTRIAPPFDAVLSVKEQEFIVVVPPRISMAPPLLALHPSNTQLDIATFAPVKKTPPPVLAVLVKKLLSVIVNVIGLLLVVEYTETLPPIPEERLFSQFTNVQLKMSIESPLF